MSDSSPNTQALPSGTRLEEFLIERVLGAGGFGITYLATDTALGRQVVIKENLPVQFAWRDPNSFTVAPRHSHGEDADNFAWSLENFSREAAMLASLDHPGIVRVHRSFRAFGTAYFVMPFVEGATLDERAWQREGGLISENELRGMLQRVLGALSYLHDRGIYHRDIKPGNILITNKGIPVLIDFGSARQKLSERSMTVVESPGYTPFEQLQSRGNVGPWSDLYALAATLAKIITGEAPPKATDRAFDDPWVPLTDRSNLNGEYSSLLLTSVDRAFAARPGDRWQDASEWLGALPSEVQEAFVPPHADPPPRSTMPASPLAGGKIGDEVKFPIRNGEEIVVKYLPGGRFQMGSPPGEEGRKDDEDQVWVSLSSHYWMAETEVTQELWAALMGSNPSEFKGEDSLPVENVSWNDAQIFIAKLNSESPPGAGWKWALPTEAQWERACRGGTKTATAFGDSLSSRQANFNGSHPYGGAAKGPNLEKTTPSKNYQPNAYGLYDMHGNVWEWCEDAYQDKLPGGDDPLVSLGKYHVGRGGGWIDCGAGCRSADRDWGSPVLRPLNLGFRLAAVPVYREEGESALVPHQATISQATPPLITAVVEESPTPGTERDFHIAANATMRFCWIPPGEFVMGGSDRALGRREDEVQHKVVLTKGYWMSKHQVTQRDWIAVVKHNPSRFVGSDLPVENVSWFDVCGVKGRQVGFLETTQDSAPKGWRFDLPTEAEWERACRAGGDDQMVEIGQSIQLLRQYLNRTAWYCANSGGRTQPVGGKEANAWGLHDMIGNVWEWCRDSYGLFSGEILTDPMVDSASACRVLRGGGWCNDPLRCRPFCRDYNYPDHVSDNVGFRLVLRQK